MLGKLLVLGASAFSAEQTTAINGALTDTVTTVMDTFVDMLPIIALVAGVGFGIAFVKGQFNRVRKGK